MDKNSIEKSVDAIPLCVVTDAKDTYDKSTGDTPSFGSQKSLAFTISWLRATLRRPNVALRWTSTENMLTDPLTKDMDSSHLRKVIQSGEWCVKYHSSFVKQNNKTQKSGALVDKILVGRPVTIDDHLLGRLERFAERPGWHTEDGVVIHVARSAKSLRTPRPRHDPKSYPLRSSYARFDLSNGDSEWYFIHGPPSTYSADWADCCSSCDLLSCHLKSTKKCIRCERRYLPWMTHQKITCHFCCAMSCHHGNRWAF